MPPMRLPSLAVVLTLAAAAGPVFAQATPTQPGTPGTPNVPAPAPLKPAPGTSQMWIYPNARGGKVIADVVRLEKGHTEGLEPNITEEIVKLITKAPGGKIQKSSM